MRIVLVEFSPSGGLFHFAVQLGEGLARQGHKVLLLTGPTPELVSREEGFEVVSALATWHPQLPGEKISEPVRKARRVLRAGQLLVAWSQLAVQLVRLSPDVVLFSTWRFGLDAWGVRVVRALLPASTLGIVAHEPRPLTEQAGQQGLYREGPLLRGALSRAWAAMDVIFALGDKARTTVEDFWRPRAEVAVIPHGDEGVFARGRCRPVQDTGPVVLFFGTLTQYKGCHVLLDAFAYVRHELPDARLVLAGAVSGDLSLPELRRRAAAIEGVICRFGYVPFDEVQELFDQARVVALPYLRASQSGVAHLAQTFGRPVVASAVGDIPAAVADGVEGWLVEPGDPRALAEALLRPLHDVDEAARRGAAGQARLAKESSWDLIAAKVSSTLEHVTARRAPRRTSSAAATPTTGA